MLSVLIEIAWPFSLEPALASAVRIAMLFGTPIKSTGLIVVPECVPSVTVMVTLSRTFGRIRPFSVSVPVPSKV